jgi:hypothetical protein
LAERAGLLDGAGAGREAGRAMRTTASQRASAAGSRVWGFIHVGAGPVKLLMGVG